MPEANRKTRLSDAEIARFHDEGLVIPDYRVPDDLLGRMQKEVDDLIARHPDVREVAVFGIPHDKWGETPVAAVVLKAGANVDAATLRDWINAHVAAKFQRVDRVLILDGFPRNAAGKTLKRELRAPYWEGRGRAI